MANVELEVLQEIRDLLMLIAEPQLEERDKKRRDELREIAGRSEKKIAAILLMDGSRTKAEISRESSMDPSDLTKLAKALGAVKLLKSDDRLANPELIIPVSSSAFGGDK